MADCNSDNILSPTVQTAMKNLSLYSPCYKLRNHDIPPLGSPERSQAMRLISDGEEALSDVRATIAFLNRAAEDLARRVDMTKSLLSPIQKVPSDVLGVIFDHFVGEYALRVDFGYRQKDDSDSSSGSSHSTSSGDNASNITRTTHLAGVCAHWRRLILSAPSLWSRISFDLDVIDNDAYVDHAHRCAAVETLRMYLERSGEHALVILLSGGHDLKDGEGFRNGITVQALEYLLSQSHRWKKAELMLHSGILYPSGDVHLKIVDFYSFAFPNLLHLMLWFVDKAEIEAHILSHVPNLLSLNILDGNRDHRLHQIAPFLRGSSSIGQMDALRTLHAQICALADLRTLIGLDRCWERLDLAVRDGSTSWEEMITPVLPDSDRSQIPQIIDSTSLRLSIDCDKEYGEEFLRSYQFRSVADLTLEGEHMRGQEPSISCSPILQAFELSTPFITSLMINSLPIGSADLLAVLKTLNALDRLDIIFPALNRSPLRNGLVHHLKPSVVLEDLVRFLTVQTRPFVPRVPGERDVMETAEPVDILPRLKHLSIRFNDDSSLNMDGFADMVKSRWSPMKDLKEAERHTQIRVEEGWVPLSLLRSATFVGKNVDVGDDIVEALRVLHRPWFRMAVEDRRGFVVKF
jgi:hypothetical protein